MKAFKKISFISSFILILLFIQPTVNASSGWGFKKNNEHKIPDIGSYANEIKDLAYYVGPEEKTIYLTFDVGYDNGNLSKILDTLKEENLKATFFVTGDFVERFPELLRRISDEGHLIGNHTYNHKDITKLSYRELERELDTLNDQVYEVTGKRIDRYFRPPEGKFDRQSLENVKKMGYETIFWSIAYVDWYQDKSYGKEYVLKNVINNLHDGAICLMHSVSKDNAEYLSDVIKEVKNQGYQIKNLDSFL